MVHQKKLLLDNLMQKKKIPALRWKIIFLTFLAKIAVIAAYDNHCRALAIFALGLHLLLIGGKLFLRGKSLHLFLVQAPVQDYLALDLVFSLF